MPGQMPEMLSRGPNLLKLDSLLTVAGGKQAAVLAALENLTAAGDPLDTAAQDQLRKEFFELTTGKTGGSAFKIFNLEAGTHFRDDWLTGKWWPEADPVAPVLREGYITAIRIALAQAPKIRESGPPLDIESLWVCTPPLDQDAHTADSGRVHVGITWSDRGVIVIIYTPRLPDEGVTAPGPNDTVDQVVVVRWDGAMAKTKIVPSRPTSTPA